LVVIGDDGTRVPRFFESKAEAEEVRRELTKLLATEGVATVGDALDKYEIHLRRKGNKPRSIATTMARIASYFPDRATAPLRSLSPADCKLRYTALQERSAVDTHRNTLAEVKTFLGWCVREGYLARHPAIGLEGEGKRRRGKPQLRVDEARRWQACALELATGGTAGAVAAMMSLLMAMRAEEIVSRTARDLDDDSRLLWIPDSKTEAGRRTLEVPAVLQPLLRRLAADKAPGARIFGHHWRDWPREWVQKICDLAGVPRVCAHSMRGLHATLAEEAGVTAHVVAASLGHESSSTTHAHYTSPSAVSRAQQRRALQVLGKGGSEK
jgi:integrase